MYKLKFTTNGFKILANFGLDTCPVCNKFVCLSLYQQQGGLSIYFIPIIKDPKRYFIACSYAVSSNFEGCNYIREITENKAKEFTNQFTYKGIPFVLFSAYDSVISHIKKYGKTIFRDDLDQIEQFLVSDFHHKYNNQLNNPRGSKFMNDLYNEKFLIPFIDLNYALKEILRLGHWK